MVIEKRRYPLRFCHIITELLLQLKQHIRLCLQLCPLYAIDHQKDGAPAKKLTVNLIVFLQGATEWHL